MDQPVTGLRGVGARLAERLGKLGIQTLQDLILHLPLRYEDRTRPQPIGGLLPGQSALVQGEVALTELVGGGRRRLLCRISDGTGSLTLVFFRLYPGLQARLSKGVRLACFGDVRPGPAGLQMAHPEIRVLHGSEASAESDRLTPVYPATEGVNQTTLRRLVQQALEFARAGLPDLLPDWLAGNQLPGLLEALETVHGPAPDCDVEAMQAGMHPACRRLSLEELLAHQLSLRQFRIRARRERRAPVLRGDGRLRQGLLDSLPFSLTAAQRRVLTQIEADLGRTEPMLRLVQGDVGSGKTIVAALAALQAVECGQQAAVMAPTELLAEQHHQGFRSWLEPLGVEVAWLSGKLAAGQRRRMLERIASADCGVVVGTHALFQDEVRFHRLGLAIIDEQHRFGVHQRLALREKGQDAEIQPHQMIMTATPIPRTLAMTAYADLDVSVIDELPPGRTPVTTVAIPEARRGEVMARVAEACADGHQAYWVCTLVEESEQLQAQAAEDTAALLREALPALRTGLVHGRMKSAEKEAVMADFAAHRLDLLVATTVIEVGVNVPNASLMVIENPERLGLAQLHQLRGRVGRGAAASSCVLLYQAPLSEGARARLGVLRRTADGFEIARQDLAQRGPGELLGTRQTGDWQFRIADPERDADLLARVRDAADRLLQHDPARSAALIHRWVGRRQQYGRV
nr:ATP-dependent DNA helicase RecG [Methylonatrum kenyense]